MTKTERKKILAANLVKARAALAEKKAIAVAPNPGNSGDLSYALSVLRIRANGYRTMADSLDEAIAFLEAESKY